MVHSKLGAYQIDDKPIQLCNCSLVMLASNSRTSEGSSLASIVKEPDSAGTGPCSKVLLGNGTPLFSLSSSKSCDIN